MKTAPDILSELEKAEHELDERTERQNLQATGCCGYP